VEGNKAVTLYETLFVVHPEKGMRMKELVERFKKVIEGQDGAVAQVDEWGVRDLAYRIEKQSRGYYTLLRYRATGRAVEELERNLKLTDDILRYMTVRADEENVAAPAAAAAQAPQTDAPAGVGTGPRENRAIGLNRSSPGSGRIVCSLSETRKSPFMAGKLS
jgi:small subunit ribosomal protein S6